MTRWLIHELRNGGYMLHYPADTQMRPCCYVNLQPIQVPDNPEKVAAALRDLADRIDAIIAE